MAVAYGLAREARGGVVSTSSLAERMAVSPAAVVHMARRLHKDGWVKHTPYQGIRLTPKGEAQALKSLRRVRVIGVFLKNVLGMDWHDIHREAAALSQVVGETLLARMDALAGHPTRCPFGEPIPDAAGVMAEIEDMSLVQAEAPSALIVSRVRTRSPAHLQYLASLRLAPGQAFTLLSREPFNGPLCLDVGGRQAVLSGEMAALLQVVKEQ
ncbi:MAG: metal-dependent transcriptional regulator [Anaerolineae bacterium]|nr:metal-dependent transcriptional regulator [Anaerolineae bacterium]